MRKHDPETGTQTLLTGTACLAVGVGLFGFAAWAANDDIRQNGKLDADAITGLAIVGCGGLMFLLFGVLATYGGWKDRGQAKAIRAATAVTPPAAGSWRPPADLTDHLGRPLGSDADYFVMPPPEIGRVRSADTSLAFGAGGRSFPVNAARALAAGLCVGSATWLLMKLAEPNDPGAWWIGGGLCGWLAGTLAWGKVRFRHACCYVGERGVARFEAAGTRDNLIVAEMFLFENATDVTTSREERAEGGFYRGTDFRFDWADAGGAVVFQIAGTYLRDYTGRNPWTDVPYQWGLAAAAAWRAFPRPNQR